MPFSNVAACPSDSGDYPLANANERVTPLISLCSSLSKMGSLGQLSGSTVSHTVKALPQATEMLA